MRRLPTSLLLVMSMGCYAQDLTKEINDHVWRPFIASFNKFDTEGFMRVHSRDLIRSPRDAKVLLSWDQYYNQQLASDRKQKANGNARQIELRFTERIANPKQAIDVGIYKTTATNREGKSVSFFGRFHVVMRKEEEGWRILVDTDSSEGNTISEKDFLAAGPME